MLPRRRGGRSTFARISLLGLVSLGIIYLLFFRNSVVSSNLKSTSDQTIQSLLLNSRISTFSEALDRLKSAHHQHHASTLRICFITHQFSGLTQNGGMGTALTALSQHLARAGHRVTVLSVKHQMSQTHDFAHWQRVYADQGIELVPMPQSDVTLFTTGGSPHLLASWQAYRWLLSRQDDFDVLHFHDWQGPGYFTVQAKRQGSAFARTLIITGIHCPERFYRHGNMQHVNKVRLLLADYLEREQVRGSDIVISPSKFVLDWVSSERGWVLPSRDRLFVQPNVLSSEVFVLRHEVQDEANSEHHTDHPQHQRHHQNEGHSDTQGKLEFLNAGNDNVHHQAGTLPSRFKVREFVFFGRLEMLKGLGEFLDALDILAGHGIFRQDAYELKITFMGHANMRNIVDQIKQRQKDHQWPFEVQFLTTLVHHQAIDYLRNSRVEGRVVFIASRIENSPYAVLECLALRIPFLAMNVGGIGELVSQDDHMLVLIESRIFSSLVRSRPLWHHQAENTAFTKTASPGLHSDSHQIASRMMSALTYGIKIASPSLQAEPDLVKLSWLRFHDTYLPQVLHDIRSHPSSAPSTASSIDLSWSIFDVLGEPEVSQQHRDRLHERSSLPMVSVVICHHNRGVHLIEAIRSVLHQQTDCQPSPTIHHSDDSSSSIKSNPTTSLSDACSIRVELIVVDDGSTDEQSLRVLSSLPEILSQSSLSSVLNAQVIGDFPTTSVVDDDRLVEFIRARFYHAPLTFENFRLIRQENRFPGAARNHGADFATGDFIIFLDDDDLVKPNWLSTMVKVARHTDAQVVTTLPEFFQDSDWRPWLPRLSDSVSPHFDSIDAIPVRARWIPVGPAVAAGMYANVFGCYSALWRKSIFRSIGGYTEDPFTTFEDWELLATAALQRIPMQLVPEPLLLYRQYSKVDKQLYSHPPLNQSQTSEPRLHSNSTRTPQQPSQSTVENSDEIVHLMDTQSKAPYLNEMRALRPYLASVPDHLRDALLLAVGMYHSRK